MPNHLTPNKHSSGSGSIMALVALVLIAISSVFALKSCQSGGLAQESMERLRGIATISAKETAKFLGGKGNVILLSDSPSMVTDMTRLFQSTLEKQGLRVLSVERLDAMDGSETTSPRGFFPGKALLPLLLQYPDVDAVISLIGVPYFKEIPSEKPPHFIAAYGVAPDMPLKQLIQSGWLSMVITPRFSPSVESREMPSSPAEWFAQQYQIFTAKNAKDLPQ